MNCDIKHNYRGSSQEGPRQGLENFWGANGTICASDFTVGSKAPTATLSGSRTQSRFFRDCSKGGFVSEELGVDGRSVFPPHVPILNNVAHEAL